MESSEFPTEAEEKPDTKHENGQNEHFQLGKKEMEELGKLSMFNHMGNIPVDSAFHYKKDTFEGEDIGDIHQEN